MWEKTPILYFDKVLFIWIVKHHAKRNITARDKCEFFEYVIISEMVVKLSYFNSFHSIVSIGSWFLLYHKLSFSMGIHKMDVVVVVRNFNVIFDSRLFFVIRLPMYYVCSVFTSPIIYFISKRGLDLATLFQIERTGHIP